MAITVVIKQYLTNLADYTPAYGAKPAYDRIIELGLGVEFIDALEDYFGTDEISEDDIDNILWHESEIGFRLVGLDENGNPKKDEEDEEAE